jgi:hypothetical protein
LYELTLLELRVYGPHEARVYRVSEAYAQLYQTGGDSRSFREAPSNVDGGLGIFTAFNSRVRTFRVR